MPRADFYLIAKPRFREEPLRLVCELARKAHDAGQPTLILARDLEQAEALDDLLWAFDDDAYIPNQIAGDDEDELAPVLIATPDMDVPLHPLLLNLRPPPVDGTCERVLDVVPVDASHRGRLGERRTGAVAAVPARKKKT